MIKKYLPEKIESYLRYFRAYYNYLSHFLYDLKRFSKHSIKRTYPEHKTQLTAKIISLYHVLEKGLTMPDTRLGFGKERIELLISLLKLYTQKYNGNESEHYKSSLKVLQSYVDLHKETDIDTEYISNFLIKERLDNSCTGGYYEMSKDFFLDKVQGNFEDIVNVRSSIRNFSNESVSIERIKEAIKLAQQSPSTCNRQAGRVYVINDKNTIKQALELQGGANGFNHKINKLLMVGFDIESYQGSGDRYSGYIDASLFAMSLLYALTYKGLGAVSLNWSKPKETDIKLRNLVNIKPSHNIIFFIGVGHLNDTTKVAVSTRYSLEEILVEL